jgi:uncharacterized protein
VATKNPVPAVEGWFTLDEDRPALLGTRCSACGTVFFPRETYFCRNPRCAGRELEEVELSRRGTIWSFTDNCYQPPPPYVAVTDPFEPFTLAAVELAEERMVVMGQVVPGFEVDDLHVGMSVELVIDTLFEDDENEYLVWKWKPVDAASGEGGEKG